MSLIVYPYLKSSNSKNKISNNRLNDNKLNDLFGLESWRKDVWGSSILTEHGCKYITKICDQDIFAEGEDIDSLQDDLLLIKENIESICKSLQVTKVALLSRVDNALSAIRIAKSDGNSGIYIG